jgi:hypothetical protein
MKDYEMGRACSQNGRGDKIFVGKSKGKRPRRRWVENITIDFREIGWVVWTGSIWLKIGTSGGLS